MRVVWAFCAESGQRFEAGRNEVKNKQRVAASNEPCWTGQKQTNVQKQGDMKIEAWSVVRPAASCSGAKADIKMRSKRVKLASCAACRPFAAKNEKTGSTLQYIAAIPRVPGKETPNPSTRLLN